MGSMDAVKGYEPSTLLEGFPWASLGKGTVVDLGGSHGSVRINLARRYPNLKCIVQDLAEVVVEGQAKLPSDVAEQVSFQVHDFFTTQPVSADVYYMRSITHNWSDKYCIKLLRGLIPALKPGARLLVHELVLPPPNTLALLDEKCIRHLDVGMLQLLNAHQREADEFRELFAAADPRFKIVDIRKPPGGAESIIEVLWT